jgi:hypothetical protein
MQPPSFIFHPANLSYPAFAHAHLPEFESLDRYELPWAIFGTLTYAKNPPLPTTQLRDFWQLMIAVGTLNHSHPDLLHWFARVEHSAATAQFKYSVKKNLPYGIHTREDIVERCVNHGIVAAISTHYQWGVEPVVELAADMLEDVNAHTEAKLLRDTLPAK